MIWSGLPTVEKSQGTFLLARIWIQIKRWFDDLLGSGIEKEYEQKVMPDGRFNIDGFICLFDVSMVPSRPIDKQIDMVAAILTNLMKSKKPIVLATTKNDEAFDGFVREAERLIARKEFKGGNLLNSSLADTIPLKIQYWIRESLEKRIPIDSAHLEHHHHVMMSTMSSNDSVVQCSKFAARNPLTHNFFVLLLY